MPTSDLGIDNPLLEEDVAKLATETGCAVDTLREGDLVGVVVRSLSLPAGIYNKPTTDVLLQTTIQYPVSAMDMFWVDLDLKLATGAVPAGGESIEQHFGLAWRRYSWHRNVPWVPGRDCLSSHFEFATARLQRAE
jgi:hypothetical protein